ncbi:MAG: Rab family GTPase [Promethearchaeota archaeon]
MREIIVKVAIAGEGGTGKTTLLHRLVKGEFIADMKMTIGTGLMTYAVTSGDYKITFQLWDFAGEERFRFFLPNYLKGAKAVLLCYDTTRMPTLNNLEEWYEIIESVLKVEETILYLIGTKIDLTEKKSVKPEVVKDWMKGRNFKRFFETSAKTGKNIEEVFKELAKDILEMQKENIEKGNIIL